MPNKLLSKELCNTLQPESGTLRAQQCCNLTLVASSTPSVWPPPLLPLP